MGVDLQPVDSDDREPQGHHELAGDLCPFVEPKAALAGDFQQVVDEADQRRRANDQ